MVEQKYRWDFIGLSTDSKPTPSTSPKVVDGSTFYCSDNSKLYVWCKTQWYERKALGGDSLSGTTAPTTATVGTLGKIYIDTTNGDAYICVAEDDVTPSYTWKKITP